MIRSARGFVLPLVLIVLALLTTLSMGLSQMAASRMQDIQQRKDLWSLEKQARKSLQAHLYVLLTGNFSQQAVRVGEWRFYLDRRPATWDGMQVRVQDGAGLFSLAQYDPRKFQLLLQKITEPDVARRISVELADWTDADNTRQFRGMEAAAYISRGLDQVPRNGPIRSLEELLLLPSMTEDIFFGTGNRVGLRDLVLAGGTDHFNIATAPAQVLGPMLGMSKSEEMRLLSAREQRNWVEMRRLVNPGDWIFNQVSPFAHGNRYVLEFQVDDGFVTRAQVNLTPYAPDFPYKLIDWRAPDYGNG